MEMETLSQCTCSSVNPDDLENYRIFLRSFTDKFTNNIYNSRDYTYHDLKSLVNDNSVKLLSGDKDSSVVIVDTHSYYNKLESMVQEGIDNGIYIQSEDNTYSDLQHFQQFLYRNFKDHKCYKDMWPSSNQPARLYGTAKTHKFNSIDTVNIDDLKFRPVMDQTGTFTYKASKVISRYLSPLCKNEYTIKDTLDFADFIKEQPPLHVNEEYVSYDVESLFTNIPLHETIEHIIDQIYNKKQLPIICSKTIIRRLLLKLTTECTFKLNDKLYKQIDGCAMGGPVSVTLADIFMNKLESDVVEPLKPKLYKRYVDDCMSRRYKNKLDVLLDKLNNYHEKIRLTVEINPKKFLDTEMNVDVNGQIITSVHRNEAKLPVPFYSHIPTKYKRNALNGELHRAKRIASNFNKELKLIRDKYTKAKFPSRFINSVISNFNNKSDINDEYIIPPDFFDIPKKHVHIELPYCELNEKLFKTFIRNFHEFTNGLYTLSVKWNTRNIRSLFQLKDKVTHISHVIYEGACSCGNSYIGETKRNFEIRKREHENIFTKSTEVAKHLSNNLGHSVNWNIIRKAPKRTRTRRNLESFYIAIKKPTINEKVKSNTLTLFRNGVT